jgi:CHASE3 domain sensor protein
MIPSSLKHQIRSGVALSVVIMGLMGVLAYSSTTTQIVSARWVAHSHHVLETLSGLLSDVEAAETAQRGYLLSADVSHLEAYTAATQASDARLQELRQLTVDNASQQQRLTTLAPVLTAKMDDMSAKIDITRTAGFDAAREAVRAGQGKRLMDRVTALIREMDGDERRLLQSRGVLAEVDANRTKLVIVVVSVFALMFLGGASVVIDRNLTRREQIELALQQAKAEAEEANRSKSEFLSCMSHELCTPINAILGFAQVLEMGQLTPEDRNSVAHILKGGRHLLVLINEVLDIARIEAGR